MRLQSQKSREYKGKDYKKFWIVISNKLVEKLGWKSGDELGTEIDNNQLIVRRLK